MWSENFEAKITKSKRSEKFKVKKSENKRKNRLEFRFALFRIEAKITKVKRSEKFEAKRSEKIEVKFYRKQAKHMWNGSNFALFRLKAKKNFKRNGRTLPWTWFTRGDFLLVLRYFLDEPKLPQQNNIPTLNENLMGRHVLPNTRNRVPFI